MPAKRKFDTEIEHRKFIAWHRARSQAQFRGEGWSITLEQWFKMWPNALWRRRGRARNALCMTRRDITLPWTEQNCKIVTRLEHLQSKHSQKPRQAWWQREMAKL